MKMARPVNGQSLMLSVLILITSMIPALAYYHPDEGRWISRDPLENADAQQYTLDLNLYGFLSNNGIAYWDYLGLKTARFVQRRIWFIPLPDKLIWDLDERESAKIQELTKLILCLEKNQNDTKADHQQAIATAQTYIQAINDYQPSCGRACSMGYTCTFNFERYEGTEPAWKTLLSTGLAGFCCGFEVGTWYSAICSTCPEGGFDPNLHTDQEDGEWHYHWDEQPHGKRGGGPHWDRGKSTGPKPRPQEWSPDGSNWYPK